MRKHAKVLGLLAVVLGVAFVLTTLPSDLCASAAKTVELKTVAKKTQPSPKFDGKAHMKRGTKCTDCHAGPPKLKPELNSMAAWHKVCVDCHKAKAAAVSCTEGCHVK